MNLFQIFIQIFLSDDCTLHTKSWMCGSLMKFSRAPFGQARSPTAAAACITLFPGWRLADPTRCA
jgi:hypothetical protein